VSVSTAPAWWWIDLANVLLGANQALAWSMTVIMKVDLVGPRRRGLALGLNEFAGYVAVGVMSWVTGYIAAHWALRPQPFYPGIAIAVIGLAISVLVVRETHGHAHVEAAAAPVAPGSSAPSLGRIFLTTSLGNASLFAACQAGLVNNLNDGMAWGLCPLFFAAHGLGVERIGVIMYPTLLAAITDHAHPLWRASSLGVYRFWRDLGYAVGALLSGVVADVVGLGAAIHLVALLTLLSGLLVIRVMARPVPVILAASPR